MRKIKLEKVEVEKRKVENELSADNSERRVQEAYVINYKTGILCE